MQSFIRSLSFGLAIIWSMSILSGCAIWSTPPFGGEYVRPWVEEKVASTPASCRLESKVFEEQRTQFHYEIIEVRGMVSRVIDKGGQPVIVLQPNFSCRFGKLRKREVKMIKEGQTLIIKGWVYPLKLGLDACQLVAISDP